MALQHLLRAFCALVATQGALVAAQPVLADGSAGVHATGQFIDLSICLEPENSGLLGRALDEISDPHGPGYGRYLTREEAKSLLQPRQESVESVRRWLSDTGVPDDHVQDRGQLIYARVAVEHLSTRLGLSARDDQAAAVAATLTASVPAELRGHVIAIRRTVFSRDGSPWAGLHRESRPNMRHAGSLEDGVADGQYGDPPCGDLRACKTKNTPACLRKLYHMDHNYAKPDKKSLMGIAGFDKQTAQHDQLQRFLHAYAKYAVGTNFSTELVNGGQNPQGKFHGAEGNLDIQYAVAMAYNVPVRFYAVGGEDHDFVPDLDISDPKKEYIEPWLPFLNHLLDLHDDQLPKVLSISYGVNEQAVPRAHAKQVCDMFGQLGTRGVSVVVASGDSGPGSSCQSNDGTKATKFLPSFPASCPYVTSVGSTESNGPEVAMNFTSGGFSEYWSRPAWQDEAVKGYLVKHGKKWERYYNAQGRAFPDVAAQGKAYSMFEGGKDELADGTSASAPMFASVIALLNDARFKQDRPPMGFLNPWLYAIGHRGFVDITEGRSQGCAGTSYSGKPAPRIPGAGWDAVPGWDPVTGWGTPLFDRLKILASR